MKPQQKAVFLDRDGVLNEDVGYLYKIEDFKWQQEAPEAIQYLKSQGYFIVVVTNQSGIARGYYEEKDVHILHNWLNEELKRFHTQIDAFYYCPHHHEGVVQSYKIECNCRKPKAGMIETAIQEYQLDRTQSFLIGDKISDLTAAQAAQMKGYLFHGGSLLTFVQQVLKEFNNYVQ